MTPDPNPLSIDTLGKLKRIGSSLSAHCGNPNCGHSQTLDLDMLIGRYGEDYVFIRETRIARAIRCKSCGWQKGGSLILSPGGTWDGSQPNAYAKAKGG